MTNSIPPEQRDELMAILRQFAAQHASVEEIEYVVELVLEIVSEEEACANATRLGQVLQEMLEETCLFDAATMGDCVQQLVKLLRQEDSSLTSAVEAALEPVGNRTTKYAPGKFCVAVLEEDQQWHDAKIVDVASELQQLPHQQQRLHPGKNSKGCTGAPRDDVDQQAIETEDEELLVEVEFFEYGKRQLTKTSEIVLEEDIAESEQASTEDEVQKECPGLGKCLMCERMTRLTEHHLIPRMVHAKYLQKGYTKEFLNTTILICRPCHSKIHAVEDEKSLAKHFNTLETILQHPEIQRWLTFARKQKVRLRPVKKNHRHIW